MPPGRASLREMSYEPNLLDETNRRILDELQADARLPLAELGRRVGMSAPAVGERVTRLEEAGVITGYRAVVDPRALGFGVSAIVRIRPATRPLATRPRSRTATGSRATTASC